MVVTSSSALLNDSYTHPEVEMLSRTFPGLWHKPNQESGLNLGQRILVRFLEIKPDLRPNFPESGGGQLGTFFHYLIVKNRGRSLMTESRILGKHHYEMGKNTGR